MPDFVLHHFLFRREHKRDTGAAPARAVSAGSPREGAFPLRDTRSPFRAFDRAMEQKDIEYFKTLLSNMLVEAQQKGDSTLQELSGDNELFADPADRATAESDRAFTLRIRDRERRLIKKVKEALQRINDGTYGICEECGEEISINRLKARPVTRLCINCKAKQEQDESQRG